MSQHKARRYHRRPQQWIRKGDNHVSDDHITNNSHHSRHDAYRQINRNKSTQQRNYHAQQRSNYHHPRSSNRSYHHTPHQYKPYTNKKRPKIGPQPHGLKRKRLHHLTKYQYWVTEKSDGIRLIAYISNHNTYFIDRKHDIHRVTLSLYSGDHGLPQNTVLDGELIRMQIDNTVCDQLAVYGFTRSIDICNDYSADAVSICNNIIYQHYHSLHQYDQLTYKIFDCIVYDGTRVTKLNSSKRLQYVDRFINIYNQQLLRCSATEHNEVNHAVELSDVARRENNNDPKIEQLKDKIWNMINRDAIDAVATDTKIYSNQCNDHVVGAMQKRLPLVFNKKTFYRSIQSDMRTLFSRINKEDQCYFYTDFKRGTRNKNDGVVFTPENNNYFMNRKGSNVDDIRKWKPLELNTIDIKIKIYNAFSGDIMDNFRDYDGFVSLYVMDWNRNKEVVFDVIDIGWNRNKLTTFQRNQQYLLTNIYKESNAERNRFRYLIVECCYDLNVQSWKILKWRKDKKVANALNVCNDARVMIMEGGIKPTDLINACPISYKQLQIVHNYNDKAANMSMIHRENSPMKHIRDMNNWCKYVLIMHGIRDAYSANGNQKIHVLDLGCGKSGDLIKYRGNKKYVSMYLGIDIASECVERAKYQYEIMKRQSAAHQYDSYQHRKRFGVNNAYGQTVSDFYNEPLFEGGFLCYDMVSANLYKHPCIQNKAPFHLITIQFALHYAFQSKHALDCLLKTICACTKPGSYLICSFVRDDEIMRRLKACDVHKDNVVFRNKFQSIAIKKADYEKIIKVYHPYNSLNVDADDTCEELVAIPYIYYQLDSVDHVEEYLVSFCYLCNALRKSCNMKLIFRKTRQELKDEYSHKVPFKYGYDKRQLPQTWTKDEQQVLDTYAYAMFERV